MIIVPSNSNRLLSRQIKRAFPDGNINSENVNTFIELVNEAYIATEQDRIFYHRAETIANKELETVNKELQVKNDFLDSFNHGMAHDIKNHSSNIIGLLYMIKKYTASENLEMVKQIVEKLDLSANQLTSIVQGFLYLSRAETKIDNDFVIIKEEELIQLIDIETQYLMQGRSVLMNYDLNITDLFYSRHILKIILVNLISNSIKYSKPNLTCIVEVSIVSDAEKLIITVKDNGIGIDLEKADKKLYNLFNQNHKSHEKGFGVGLFLIKKIVERNNGKIKLESTVDIGTEVEIILPLN